MLHLQDEQRLTPGVLQVVQGPRRELERKIKVEGRVCQMMEDLNFQA